MKINLFLFGNISFKKNIKINKFTIFPGNILHKTFLSHIKSLIRLRTSHP